MVSIFGGTVGCSSCVSEPPAVSWYGTVVLRSAWCALVLGRLLHVFATLLEAFRRLFDFYLRLCWEVENLPKSMLSLPSTCGHRIVATTAPVLLREHVHAISLSRVSRGVDAATH